MSRRFLSIILLLVAPIAHASGDPQPDPIDFWQVDGEVRAMQLVGSTLYIGGGFKRVYPPTGSAVPFDLRTGLPLPGFPRIRDGVFAIVSDGVGGWYLGGAFASAGEKPIANLAHVRQNLTVVDWSVSLPSIVTALALSGGRLYVGGNGFVTAVDPATGRQLPWQASPDGLVTAIAPAGDRVFIGGSMLNVNNRSAYGLAALDANTAVKLDWNPALGLGAATNARAMVVVGNTLYVGGYFNGKLSGVSRRNLVAIDTHSGAILPWNPDPDGFVSCLAADHGRMFVGGGFFTIGGSRRTSLALVDLATGAARRWSPEVDGGVGGISLSGNLLYVIGSFGTVDGAPHPLAVAFDLTTGRPTSWGIPTLFCLPNCAAVGRGAIYVGGQFPLGVGSVMRGGVAALNALTGEPTSWDPEVSNVYALLVEGDVVYIGGGFSDVGGTPRKCLAAVDRTIGRLLPWSPEPNGGVDALASIGGTLYVGGSFTQIAGHLRGAGAAFSLSNRRLDEWDPKVRGAVYTMLAAGDRIYIGGYFSALAGPQRRDLAAVSAVSGAPLSWNPVVDRSPGSSGGVYALARSGQSVFAGGLFEHVNGAARPYLAEIDASGALMPLDLGLGDFVFGLHVEDGVLYAGGFVPPMAIDIASRTRLRWSAQTFGRVTTITSGAGLAYIGAISGLGLTVLHSAHPLSTASAAVVRSAPLIATEQAPGAFRLSFALPAASAARLAVYDVAGRQVARLADDVLATGTHEFTWETRADGVRPGIYFARLDAGPLHATTKLVVF